MASYKEFIDELKERLENSTGLDDNISLFNRHFLHVDTASDFLTLVRYDGRTLYGLTGNKLTQILQENFSPDQLLEEGILINPDVLPQSRYMVFNVFFTEPHELTVDPRLTNYIEIFGDAKLRVLQGHVYVHDSKLPCEAFGASTVAAYGRTSVIAHDDVEVTLHDRSRCLALDQSSIL